MDHHFLQSSYREKIIEHLFIGVPKNRFRSDATLEEIFTVLFGRKPAHSLVTP